MINGTLVLTLLNLFDTIEHEKYNFDGYWTLKKIFVVKFSKDNMFYKTLFVSIFDWWHPFWH